jgi:hypothetical protein
VPPSHQVQAYGLLHWVIDIGFPAADHRAQPRSTEPVVVHRPPAATLPRIARAAPTDSREDHAAAAAVDAALTAS